MQYLPMVLGGDLVLLAPGGWAIASKLWMIDNSIEPETG